LKKKKKKSSQCFLPEETSASC
jgi:hypothetical protein